MESALLIFLLNWKDRGATIGDLFLFFLLKSAVIVE